MNQFSFKEWKVICLRETQPAEAIGACDNPLIASHYWREVMATDPRHNADVESLYVIHLNTRKKITGHHLVATGILDTLLCHPREVFRAAIVANCSAILVMHNHPSGDPTPSEADIKVTRDLIRAGQLLKIDVVDHVVMGKVSPARSKDYSSLRELGYFYA